MKSPHCKHLMYRDSSIRTKRPSGPPYFEEYTDCEIYEGVIAPHMKDGVVVYATDSETLIGFGCAIPFNRSPDDVQEFLSNLSKDGRLPRSFDYKNAWYMSELGVRCSYRGMGIAWELVRLRMLQVIAHGCSHYFMRTASVESNSMPMYMKSGAIPVSQQQGVSSNRAGHRKPYSISTKNLSLGRLYKHSLHPHESLKEM